MRVIDYVGFIKKVMKQLQNPRYVLINRTDVDLRQLDDSELLAATPGDHTISACTVYCILSTGLSDKASCYFEALM